MLSYPARRWRQTGAGIEPCAFRLSPGAPPENHLDPARGRQRPTVMHEDRSGDPPRRREEALQPSLCPLCGGNRSSPARGRRTLLLRSWCDGRTALPLSYRSTQCPGQESNLRPVDEESITAASPARSRRESSRSWECGRSGFEPHGADRSAPLATDNRAAPARDNSMKGRLARIRTRTGEVGARHAPLTPRA